MSKLKYKVGDRVKIKSLDWYNKNKDSNGNVKCGNQIFTYPMTKLCGKTTTIICVNTKDCYYVISGDDGYNSWTDEMIECKVEEETKPGPKFKVGDRIKWYNHTCNIISIDTNENTYTYLIKHNDYREDKTFAKWVPESELTFEDDEETKPEPKFYIGDIVYSKTWQRNVVIMEILPDGFYKVGEFGTGWFKSHEDNLCKDIVKPTLLDKSKLLDKPTDEYTLPDGYVFKDENGNVINATKIILEKKKKEYPKTYEECCKVLNVAVRDFDILYNMLDTTEIIYTNNLDRLLNSFRKLLICRDAYWKIVGEEMGLGKPWKPDWNNISDKYCIYFVSGDTWSKECQTRQCPFAFPTPEMRDAFYENFKVEIEICKELL